MRVIKTRDIELTKTDGSPWHITNPGTDGNRFNGIQRWTMVPVSLPVGMKRFCGITAIHWLMSKKGTMMYCSIVKETHGMSTRTHPYR